MILENEFLSVRISSGRGARIESFFDKKKNKEWVWKPENSPDPDRTLGMDEGFDANWAGGWEEIFPNDAPVEMEGFKLLDHGEVFRRTWSEDEIQKNELSFYINCETYPALVRKKIRLDEKTPRLMIDYTIESRSTVDLPFIFKLHPALNITPNDKFNMPASMMEPVALGFSRIIASEQKVPYRAGIIDSAQPMGERREFVRLSEIKEGLCSVTDHATGSEITFEFNNEEFPYIWLFQSYGGFMGHYVSMIEPCNAGHYDLSVARNENKCGILKAGEKKHFSIAVSLISN